MKMMKRKFWKSYLFALLVCLPFGAVSTSKIFAVEPVYQVAQVTNSYNQYMRLGYTETKRRNYRRALGYFQQAAQLRPGDIYATTAIRNVTGYIQGRKTLISFVPGKPSRLGSGGTRGACFQHGEVVIPLIPSDRDTQYTTQERPTFFFYIPKASRTVRELEFVLREDENLDPLYKENFKAFDQAGIVGITLKANQPPLKPGKEYTWAFSMICDPNSRDRDSYQEGKIQVMQDENIAAQVKETPTPLDRAVLYATAGFWENALSILADLRRQSPNDPKIKQYWSDLLKSVKLDAVADQPLLPPCCTTQQGTMGNGGVEGTR
ncbi:DUF928 domain-containing protein [Tolypothrix sp. PCC 7712]|nr:DUF928 domain-containing protein [Tolypothrix sp. PCC 7712]UYD37978.1 DUF928 domain-containing protein [Tolypothrix sp. PCC 7601]